MHLTVVNLLIALLALLIFRGQSVDSRYVEERNAYRAVPRSGLQTVEGPKSQLATPDTSKIQLNKSKLTQLHYTPYIKTQQVPMTPQRIKKHTGHTHRNKLIPLWPHLYTVHAITVVPQTLHQHKKTPKLVYVATTPRPRLFANETRGVAKVVKDTSSSPQLPVKTKVNLSASVYALRPPILFATSTTTTTATTMTTSKYKRIKRIWPTDMMTPTTSRTSTNASTDSSDATAASATSGPEASTVISFAELAADLTGASTTMRPPYSRFTRKPKNSTGATTSSTSRRPSWNGTQSEDWIPILPSHVVRRRSGSSSYSIAPVRAHRLRERRNYPLQVGYTSTISSAQIVGDTILESSGNHHVIIKIKHHHHHHHHKHVKTIEKPIHVPVKVIVPKPYPVEKKVSVPVEKIVHKVIEKTVPVPYPIKKTVPYPIEVKVPHPYPVKVIEKEYIPKPYPVTVPVPVVKQVEVKVPQPFLVPYEKYVPYPVEVKVPVHVEKRVPYPIEVEKKVSVPYPVPIKVYVPQPYPVEKKVPYPVEVKVKEPVGVLQKVPVPVKVYVDKHYPIKVLQAVPVATEKRIPYPVEVDKKALHSAEIDKKVPYSVKVYVPQPLNQNVSYPVKLYVSRYVSIENRLPLHVGLPDFAHNGSAAAEPALLKFYLPHAVPLEKTIPVHIEKDIPLKNSSPSEQEYGSEPAKSTPYTVTIHGNGSFKGFS